MKFLYTFYDCFGNSQDTIVCEACQKKMPLVNGSTVTIQKVDPDCPCLFCEQLKRKNLKQRELT
jgi:hypothetical protein